MAIVALAIPVFSRCVVAQYPHDGAQGTLTISAGDRIELLQCPEAEWWFGRRLADDATGYFPAAFVAIAPRPSP